TNEVIWSGRIFTKDDVRAAVGRARQAFPGWRSRPVEERVGFARSFAAIVRARADQLAELISRESGKPLWEARQEIRSVAAKVEISIAAQSERAGERRAAADFGETRLRHGPHGVMVVLGPYNFPAHLPNGHIVPALLAGK